MQSVRGKGIRVIHFDDDPEQLYFTKIILEDLDPQVSVEPHNSPVDVDAVELDGFDCVISDYQMPEMDGVELSRHVRERSDIPIIMYTGKPRGDLEDLASDVGIDDIVVKEADPQHYERLASSVREAVERHVLGLLKMLV